METINQRELRNDSGPIMRRVAAGESFVVTRHGVPVADLVPHDPADQPRARRFLPVGEIAQGLAGQPDWGVVDFRQELAALDEAFDGSDDGADGAEEAWAGR